MMPAPERDPLRAIALLVVFRRFVFPPVPVSEALIIRAQLPSFKSDFPGAGVRVYPIQTREARHSGGNPQVRYGFQELAGRRQNTWLRASRGVPARDAIQSVLGGVRRLRATELYRLDGSAFHLGIADRRYRGGLVCGGRRALGDVRVAQGQAFAAAA